MSKQKYYAVVLGRECGVFESWSECEKQVDGFSGALFKSFPTIVQANEWMTTQKTKISGSDRRLPIEIDLDNSGRLRKPRSTVSTPESPKESHEEVIYPHRVEESPAQVCMNPGKHESLITIAKMRTLQSTPLVANPYKRKRKVDVYGTDTLHQRSSTASPKSSVDHESPGSVSGFGKLSADGVKIESLIATLLKTRVSEYLECAESGWETQKLWIQLCRKQSAPLLTGPIRSQYTDANAHFRVRKSLVLEEVREAISAPLIERSRNRKSLILASGEVFVHPQNASQSLLLTIKEKGKVDNEGTVILTLHRPFPTVPGEKPDWFTDEEKDYMVPSSIFECVKEHNFSQEEAVLAVVVPCSPKRINKHMEFDVKVAAGLTSHMAPDHELRCTPTVNVISYEREFDALCRDPQTLPFLAPLLGCAPNVLNNNQRISSCVGRASTGNALVEKTDTSDDDLSRLSLPHLNATQEAAISSFIDSPRGSISIVQGPPGTGKTTLLVSTIVRFLLPEEATTARGRVLVCAPTNKAVSVVAMRLLAAVRKTGIRVILVGDEKKLLEESGGKKSPLNQLHLFNWIAEMEEGFVDILSYCKGNRPDASATEMWKLSIFLSKRVIASLTDLPTSFKDKLKALCAKLEKCANGKCSPSLCKPLAGDVHAEFADFPADHVRTQILNSAHVIFSTLCSSTGSAMIKMTRKVDALIVDEAAAATEPSLYVPFFHEPSKLLIVGDPKQLPAVVLSSKAKSLGLDVSLHDRLMHKCGHGYTMLDIQYRMNPEISIFPSAAFYDGKVNDGENVRDPNRQGTALVLTRQPYIFMQVSGMEIQNEAGSRYNVKEADAVVSIVEEICKARGRKWCSSTDRLRIITFYRGQVGLLKKLLTRKKLEDVLVGTVDASQGCEADIVVISFVRSGISPGFLTDDRRMNVSLTRARHQLICIGHLDRFLLMKNAGTLHSLATDATKRGVIVQDKLPRNKRSL